MGNYIHDINETQDAIKDPGFWTHLYRVSPIAWAWNGITGGFSWLGSWCNPCSYSSYQYWIGGHATDRKVYKDVGERLKSKDPAKFREFIADKRKEHCNVIGADLAVTC